MANQLPPTAPSYNQIPNPQDQYRQWKSKGYPSFTTWQASSRDVAIFRRFGPLSTRCALYLQDELAQLETEIDNIDELCKTFDDYGRNDSFRFDKAQQPQDPHAERRFFMDRAVCLTKQYHEYLNGWGRLRAQPVAEPRQTQNIKNWFYNNPDAVEREERKWIEKDGDLVAIAAERKTPMERWLLRRGTWLKKLFREKHIPWLHVDSATTTYSDDKLIQAVANAVVAIVGLLFLIVPMVALTDMTLHNCSPMAKTAVIVAAVVVASLALAVITDQKAFQVLLATAAYAAVLLIYLQIGGGAGGGIGSTSGNSTANGTSALTGGTTTISRFEVAYREQTAEYFRA